MKEILLTVNSKLYTFLCNVSMLFFGIRIGYTLNHTPQFDYLIFVAVYWILYKIALYLLKEQEYCSGKSCCAMAIFTLVSISGYWFVLLNNSFREIQNGFPDPGGLYNKLAIIVYPAVLFVISVIIFINYSVCANEITVCLPTDRFILLWEEIGLLLKKAIAGNFHSRRSLFCLLLSWFPT